MTTKKRRLQSIIGRQLIFGCLLFLASGAIFGQPGLVFRNPSLPIEKRVDDLVSRMTLEEKVLQMQNSAPTIDRLGIPAYNWWNEALHGVARAGTATVFPQAIGMAATWDVGLMNRAADVISTEARAKYNFWQNRKDPGIYKGLTFWSPNINIFRDPRWGRGQETYGEDPYLTGRMGVAFVRGMQGDDPRYFKVIATPKHFAVHSGPEYNRHTFDAEVSERDLRETYLPAFRALITEAKAYSIMCAYNRLRGLPACMNNPLMQDILRKEWGFNGYVVSDCGAIDDIYIRHKTIATESEASALAVKAGTDLTCGGEYRSLVEAVQKGFIKESEIDVSIKRLMTARFRLGMFDPPEMNKYSKIPITENDTPVHRAMALQAARESIVLLKNADNLLPLRKDLKTIAVIGPNADARDVVLGNYNGQPSRSVTPLEGIRNHVSPGTKVLYSEGMYQTGVVFEEVSPSAFKDLTGEYFNNRDLTGTPVLTRPDRQVKFDWRAMGPALQIPEDNFSVRWTGNLKAPDTGKYLFGMIGNGAVRIFMDDKLIIEEVKNGRTKNATREIEFEGGRDYRIRIEYQENNNQHAQAKLVWSPPNAGKRLREDALRIAKQADSVVMVMGITPNLEGEEMDVRTEGFKGGDRTDINLPKPQEQLIREIVALGKPVTLVLMGGSALAVNWANENVSAILDSWYPGEEGGTAIADVLFGDYNPAGRLPVTFYKSVDQLPPFEDYNMRGRTYRFFEDEPLYKFGFGLSYTKFEYGALKIDAAKVRSGKSVSVTADVRNTGNCDGDEVTQLYLTHERASVPVPIRSLAGFDRIFLKRGETRRISFRITPDQMQIIDNNGKHVIEPGEFSVSIGGRQPGSGDPEVSQMCYPAGFR